MYIIDSKDLIHDLKDIGHDIFVTVLNDSDRVNSVAESVSARNKNLWAVPEYGYTQEEINRLPGVKALSGSDESEIMIDGFSSIMDELRGGASLCVDITGFMRSHILFMMWYLKSNGVRIFDVLYTEPSHYSTRGQTTFSQRISAVKQVRGFEGAHQVDTSNDILVLGVGYEDQPMGQVIRSKENARLVQLHSLPSLSADMYHESLIRLGNISTISRPSDDSLYFSSADDPFVTADTLRYALSEIESKRAITNIYLSPLATKVQTLGFGLFFLREASGGKTSIILPTVERYSRKTSTGVGRTWKYPIYL